MKGNATGKGQEALTVFAILFPKMNVMLFSKSFCMFYIHHNNLLQKETGSLAKSVRLLDQVVLNSMSPDSLRRISASWSTIFLLLCLRAPKGFNLP